MLGSESVPRAIILHFSAIFPHFIAYLVDFIDFLVDMRSIFDHFDRFAK